MLQEFKIQSIFIISILYKVREKFKKRRNMIICQSIKNSLIIDYISYKKYMNKNLLDDILKSMQDNNYKIVELETTTAINERKNGKVFSFNEHVEALIWSLLSNQRPWKGISDNKNNILMINMD